MATNFQLFQVSQKGILFRGGKALIVQLSSSSGMWDLPGGRIDVGESAESAFKREFSEEVGFDHIVPGAVIDYDTFYTGNGHITNTFFGIIRKVDAPPKDVNLSSEHVDLAWITADEIDAYNFVWPNMDRALHKAFELYGKK